MKKLSFLILWLSSALCAQPIPDVASWADASQVNITRMVWAFGYGRADQSKPDDIAAALQAQPEGNRVLLILGAASSLMPAQPSDFFAFGLDDYNARKYSAALFRVRPDFIALDEEWNYSNWDLFAQPDGAIATKTLAGLYDNPLVRASMSKAVASLKPQQLRAVNAWWATNDASVLAWNDWTTQLRANALDRLVYAQARALWPGYVEYGNYADCRFRFQVEDLNGWSGSNLSNISRSCPSLYLNIGNAVNSARGFHKHPLWNNLVRTINLARSCAAAGPTRAWVSYPAYSGDNGRQYDVATMRIVWEQLIRHIAALNVKFLYWNPATADKPADDDAFAAGVFRANPVRRAIRADQMTPIPYDADEIRTGNIVTKYSDIQFTQP